MNYFLLTNPYVTLATTLDKNDIDAHLKDFITGQIIKAMKSSLPDTTENLKFCHDLCSKVHLAPADIHLNPMLSSISEFVKTSSYGIFCILKIPVFHPWTFNKQDADRLASITGTWTYDGVKAGVRKFKQKGKVPSDAELIRSYGDSTELRGQVDRDESEQLKRALIEPKLEAELSVHGHAESSTPVTESEWDYLSTIVDNMDKLGRSLSAQSLFKLRQMLKENMVAILYWNNDFVTICKRNGAIYMLVDEDQTLVTYPEAVWKILSIGDEKEIFVDGKFAPVNKDAVAHRCSSSNCTLEFYSKINYERHHKVHLPSSKVQGSRWNKDALWALWDEIPSEDAKSILLFGETVVKNLYGSSFNDILKNFVSSSDYRLISKDVNTVLFKLKRFLGSTIKPSSEELVWILNIASESTLMCGDVFRNKELFDKVMTESERTMRNVLACLSLSIEQQLAQRWFNQADKRADELFEEERSREVQKDKNVIEETESTIASDASINSVLDLPAQVDEGTTAPDINSELPVQVDVGVQTERKLLPSDIFDWPALEGEDYFPNFAARSPLVTLCTLFSGKSSIALTRIGRKAAKRLLRFILKMHER